MVNYNGGNADNMNAANAAKEKKYDAVLEAKVEVRIRGTHPLLEQVCTLSRSSDEVFVRPAGICTDEVRRLARSRAVCIKVPLQELQEDRRRLKLKVCAVGGYAEKWMKAQRGDPGGAKGPLHSYGLRLLRRIFKAKKHLPGNVTEPGTFYEKLHLYCDPVPRIRSQLYRTHGHWVLNDVVPYASDDMPVCGATVLEHTVAYDHKNDMLYACLHGFHPGTVNAVMDSKVANDEALRTIKSCFPEADLQVPKEPPVKKKKQQQSSLISFFSGTKE